MYLLSPSNLKANNVKRRQIQKLSNLRNSRIHQPDRVGFALTTNNLNLGCHFISHACDISNEDGQRCRARESMLRNTCGRSLTSTVTRSFIPEDDGYVSVWMWHTSLVRAHECLSVSLSLSVTFLKLPSAPRNALHFPGSWTKDSWPPPSLWHFQTDHVYMRGLEFSNIPLREIYFEIYVLPFLQSSVLILNLLWISLLMLELCL